MVQCVIADWLMRGWRAARSPAVIRKLPAGLSRSSFSAAMAASTSSKRGPSVRSNRPPASVGDTLRVVRVSSGMPSRSSSVFIE
jgi:hypothetical protein